MPATNKLIFVVYDGILNSVFQSQVLMPLIKKVEKSEDLEVCIVSFEKQIPPLKTILSLCDNEHIHIVAKKRPLFLGQFSLLLPIRQLSKFLKETPSTKIIARGPLAGYITINALKKTKQPAIDEIIIQARGLAAEEFKYTNSLKKQNVLKKVFNPARYKKLKNIEFEAYKKRNDAHLNNMKIEVVSPALKDYLIKTFDADENKITMAHEDIPHKIDKEKIKEWRKATREELEIPQDAIVYCYSGSARPWQCIDETIDYFKKAYKKNKNNFLLILSQDKEEIEDKLKKAKLPEHSYKILSVEPKNLYVYLAAADYGLLFRHKDIINWVSRPTKMLEYQAVGLKIIHNNTIEWLSENKKFD
jgi:hypothetical protein